MCGILGTNLDISKTKFHEALLKIDNRGPDNSSYIKEAEYYIGHTRLSIVDLCVESNQPMVIDNYIITYNGEVYNYKELKKKYFIDCKTNSDTEVILRLYEKLGSKMLEELDGMFAFAIFDIQQKKLFLARDSIGEKPLYYYHSQDTFVFSSTISAIQKLTDNLTLSKQAIWDYLSFSWIPEPDTIFNEIKALPKSSYATFINNHLHIEKYKYKYKPSTDNIIDETRKLVLSSIHRRLMSDVKVGCFLSGGLDSSIVSLIAAKKVKNIDLFSIGFNDDFCSYTGFSDETEYAKKVAKTIKNCNHHIIKISENDYDDLLDEYIDNCDQPFAVSSGLGILAISKFAKEKNIKVLLSGDGADENFGGYSWYPKLKFNDLSFFSEDRPKGWHYRFLENEKNNLLNINTFCSIKRSTRFMIEDYLEQDPKVFINHDKNFYLYNEMMTKLDRMTMSNSIEGRAIFVSPQILKFTDTLTYDILMKNGQKWLLKQAFIDEVPSVIRNRPKHGFNTPMKVWFLNRWNSKLKRLFDEDSYLVKYKIIENDYKAYFEKYKNDKRFGELSFNLLALNLWLKCYTQEYRYKLK